MAKALMPSATETPQPRGIIENLNVKNWLVFFIMCLNAQRLGNDRPRPVNRKTSEDDLEIFSV
jgi:hypothetical protein